MAFKDSSAAWMSCQRAEQLLADNGSQDYLEIFTDVEVFQQPVTQCNSRFLIESERLICIQLSHTCTFTLHLYQRPVLIKHRMPALNPCALLAAALVKSMWPGSYVKSKLNRRITENKSILQALDVLCTFCIKIVHMKVVSVKLHVKIYHVLKFYTE